ncbi:hypothetical protein KM043_008995 [Ampulex compressa]|nr:hypothetical protein KM043_008995 [Ampulex compressa]
MLPLLLPPQADGTKSIMYKDVKRNGSEIPDGVRDEWRKRRWRRMARGGEKGEEAGRGPALASFEGNAEVSNVGPLEPKGARLSFIEDYSCINAHKHRAESSEQDRRGFLARIARRIGRKEEERRRHSVESRRRRRSNGMHLRSSTRSIEIPYLLVLPEVPEALNQARTVAPTS